MVDDDVRRHRIDQVRRELLERIHERYPEAELVDVEELPTGTVLFHVTAPPKDNLGVLRCASSRIVELAQNEALYVLVLPVRRRRAKVA